MKKRKPNRHARGNNFEVKIKNELKYCGWIVYKPIRTRFAKQKDIWNMFDLISYHPRYKIIRFEQLTTDDYIAQKRASEMLDPFDVRKIQVVIQSPKKVYMKEGTVNLGITEEKL